MNSKCSQMCVLKYVHNVSKSIQFQPHSGLACHFCVTSAQPPFQSGGKSSCGISKVPSVCNSLNVSFSPKSYFSLTTSQPLRVKFYNIQGNKVMCFLK